MDAAATVTSAGDLPFAGIDVRGTDALAAGLTGPATFAVDAFALDDGFASVTFTLDAVFVEDDGFAAETLFLTVGLGADTFGLTTFAGDETGFFAGPPFFTGAAVRGCAGFAFGFAAFATEPDLDDLALLAAIFIIPEKQLKEPLVLPPHQPIVNP